jgi:hypothetical protein
MIIIEPLGGLANRMRALDSSMSLATKMKQLILLLWGLDASLNCQYQLLFEKPLNARVLNFRNSCATRLFRRLIVPLSRIYFRDLPQNNIQQFVGHADSLEQLASRRNLYIQTCGRFYPSEKPFAQLTIQDAIVSRINLVTARFSTRTVGVHIRRGDNDPSIKYSPTCEFAALMKKELLAHPETLFFVATDSLKEERVLKESFSGKIITQAKQPPDRNSPESIQDAMVDLQCLSKCCKILGSYWSSFSETAAQMGKIDLVVANQDRQT